VGVWKTYPTMTYQTTTSTDTPLPPFDKYDKTTL